MDTSDYTHPPGAYYAAPPTDETRKPLPAAPAGPVAPGLTVLILCAGAMHPWEEGEPRQLRPLGDTTILGRTISQVKKSGYTPTIVTYRDDIRDATPDCRHFEPAYRRTIAETWLYTRELWSEQTVVLLGDVIHGKKTMRKWLEYRGTMRMLGNSAEIFAFTFPQNEHQRVAEILYKANDTRMGSPWTIYRLWCGFPYNSGKEKSATRYKESERKNSIFQWPWDRTCDIDTPGAYKGALTVLSEWKE